MTSGGKEMALSVILLKKFCKKRYVEKQSEYVTLKS